MSPSSNTGHRRARAAQKWGGRTGSAPTRVNATPSPVWTASTGRLSDCDTTGVRGFTELGRGRLSWLPTSSQPPARTWSRKPPGLAPGGPPAPPDGLLQGIELRWWLWPRLTSTGPRPGDHNVRRAPIAQVCGQCAATVAQPTAPPAATSPPFSLQGSAAPHSQEHHKNRSATDFDCGLSVAPVLWTHHEGCRCKRQQCSVGGTLFHSRPRTDGRARAFPDRLPRLDTLAPSSHLRPPPEATRGRGRAHSRQRHGMPRPARQSGNTH